MPLLYRPDIILATDSELRYIDEGNHKMRSREILQTTYSRSPMTASKTSYDSCSTSPTNSPRLQMGYEDGFMGVSPKRLDAQLPFRRSGQAFSRHPYSLPYNSNTILVGTPETNSINSTSSSHQVSVAHQGSTATPHTKKRAYRQRRKDPSCDACRERKVKCDATETASCSECSSRNVKCQFTKETNRRMSSIKQVQDMEKQIAQVKRENFQLRTMLRMRDEKSGIDNQRIQKSPLLLPKIGSQPKSRLRPLLLQDFSSVRSDIRRYGQGIFKPPPMYRNTTMQTHSNHPRPDLPPKHISDHFLHSYYESVHQTMPILHWPTFEHEYEAVYRNGNFHGVTLEWNSLFFAVLALGCINCTELFIHDPQKAKEYIDISQMLTDNFNDEFNIDHARVAFLTSIFLMEINSKSAACIQLASAVRISQDIGLHIETSGSWSAIELEIRRRVWWAIYIWDRHLSLELCRPFLIEDADCDVNLPVSLDDHYIQESGIISPNSVVPPTNMILPIIHVIRAASQLIKALRSPTISEPTLRTFDNHFTACLTAFPSFLLHSNEPLHPRVLIPVCYLMNTRLILHRHNLTVICSPQIRANALEQCIRASLDTSFLISRSLAWSNSSSSFGLAAHTIICMHIWRCTLFLLYGGHLDAALTCIRASSSIGTLRDVNVSCGRNIAFILGKLIEKRRSGSLVGSKEYRNQRWLDEELIGYISGDLQAHLTDSWVWQSSESGADGIREGEINGTRINTTPRDPESIQNSAVSESETTDWGGWKKIEYLVTVLARESEDHVAPAHARFVLPSEGIKLTQERLKGNERMSITNII